ncbi:hypothetical protein B0H10DRAFT_2241314 [Mycena sp. CBHHK59/15]|nr:hypothetical protein B0H10DRAFT_2241314 [Mycena sp. CBHHK59/15]
MSTMLGAYATIATPSSSRIRVTKAKPCTPLAPDERKEKCENREIRKQKIDDVVGEWWASMHVKAEELGVRFDLSAHYFLDIFFQGGAHMINRQEKKVNPYNVFKSEKAAEAREHKIPEPDDEQKDELVERFWRSEIVPHISVATPLVAKFKTLRMSFQHEAAGLGTQWGIEVFLCIVCNNSEFHMAPEWFFTIPELEKYMMIVTRRKWDTAEVGSKAEAFAVAGCDPVNLLRTSKTKADFMKGEICLEVAKDLVEKLGDPNAKMSYKWFDEDITMKYGLVLKGWTAPRFVQPSELSTSLPALQTLLNVLKSRECHFEKLLPDALKAWKKKFREDIDAGHKAGNDDDNNNNKEEPTDPEDDNEGDDSGPHLLTTRTPRLAPTPTTPRLVPTLTMPPLPHASLQKAAKAAAPRDDEITRKARKKMLSWHIITDSKDEAVDDPHANKEEGTPTSTTHGNSAVAGHALAGAGIILDASVVVGTGGASAAGTAAGVHTAPVPGVAAAIAVAAHVS